MSTVITSNGKVFSAWVPLCGVTAQVLLSIIRDRDVPSLNIYLNLKCSFQCKECLNTKFPQFLLKSISSSQNVLSILSFEFMKKTAIRYDVSYIFYLSDLQAICSD